MNNTLENRLKEIRIENFVFVIFIIIIFMAYYANNKEIDYFINKNEESKKDYYYIMIIIFLIVVIISTYYFVDSYKDINNYYEKIALTNIGEIAAKDIALTEHPAGLKENLKVASRGGSVAKGAKDLYEKETKKTAISTENALNYEYTDDVKKVGNKEPIKK